MRKTGIIYFSREYFWCIKSYFRLFSREDSNFGFFLSSGCFTSDSRYTRITIVASGDEQILEQIEKQLAKLEDVRNIKN